MSLIEVLCAVVVISSGINFFMRSHLNSLVSLQYSNHYTLASLYVHDLAEKIRANPVGARCFVAVPADCSVAQIETEADELKKAFYDLAKEDFADWIDNPPPSLPQALASTERLDDNALLIRVQWVSGKDGSGDSYSLRVSTNPGLVAFTLDDGVQ